MSFGKILVTGGCGHLGSVIMRELASIGSPVAFDMKPPRDDVPFISGSVLALADLEDAMKGADALVHVAAIPNPRDRPAVGHYRSYSPWWTHLRIVARGDRLHLVADNGVEADKGQPELVRLDDGVFRIGADPRLPERLRLGPVVDGSVIWVDRDGCRYSRTFGE